jgi:transposase
VWRANIILATAEGCGTAEIMRRSGKSKPVVWRWQARFMAEGVERAVVLVGHGFQQRTDT